MSHGDFGDRGPPEELRELEGILRRVRFQPRVSFGAELIGRVRRGERPGLASRRLAPLSWSKLVLAGLAAMLALMFLVPEDRVTIDRCCYDLDGGGEADDGALIIGERDGRLFRIAVYEDRDGSGSYTPSDILRYDRRGTPASQQPLANGQTRIQHCCQDLDGGGPADDGLVILATPPDRIHTAAIYQLR